MKLNSVKIIIIVFLSLSALIFLVTSLAFQQSLAVENLSLRPVGRMEYEIAGDFQGPLTLPASLKDLPPRTPVSLWADIDVLAGESIYIKSVFSPLKLYIDGKLFYEYGQADTYPNFLNDPPTGIAILKLPEEAGRLSLKIEYESLSQRKVLSLPNIYIGDHAAQLNRMLKADGFSFLFSLVLMLIGLIMSIIALTFVRKVPSGRSFLWLGLFSLSAGIWVFGECDFTSRIIPFPSLLYILDYLGMFCLAIPFLHFGLVILNPKNELPIRLMLWTHYSAVAAAIFLQLIGKVDFIKSLFFFNVITPLAFVLFAICLVWEWLKNKNPASKKFAPAVLILAFSTILELVNYWFRFIQTLTIFFQFGVLFFIVSLGIVSGYYVQESIQTALENKRLEYEMWNMEKQLSLQRTQYQKIAEDQDRFKKERHDFRHHLAVLKGLVKDEDRFNEYIDHLTSTTMTNRSILLCENYAISAVASYYYNMALEAGIDITLALAVPRDLGAPFESDLSIVVGNLLENAIEACLCMDEEARKFIRLKSSLNHNIFTITVDNSYSCEVKIRDGIFYSSKHEGEGIGISSVRAIAEKHKGGSRFEESQGVFMASVYLSVA